jgi:large subunit ribosomal protein L9
MATPIRVVLQDDIDNLGSSGDVVRVRPGYARNYLIPRGLALPATHGNLARVEDLKRQATARAEKALSEARELKKKLEAMSVKLERAVGEGDRMYGSVTSKDIEEAFAAQGTEIDRRKIDLADPIKTIGSTKVPIKLHRDVVAELSVEIVKKA